MHVPHRLVDACRMDIPGHLPRPGHAALRRGRASVPCHAYHLTVTVSGRRPVFTDFDAACEAARCFEAPELLGDASMLAWVLMPDHAHWLLQLGDVDALATVVTRLKSASARRVNRIIAGTGPLWSRAFHDRALRKEDDLVSAARYIIANPIRAGLVAKAGDYPFWNAIWL
jgi:REP element-mobilizing transposase RayT